MRTHKLIAVLTTGIIVALAGTTLARNVTITIPMQEVGVRESARGEFYVVKFDLPVDLAGKRLDSVFLDFVVDASPTSEAEADATPLIAVYPLTAAATGPSLEYESDVPSVRPIAMGDEQKVRADITDIVKGWLADPSGNHGLVIGALDGPDVARVSIKSDGLAPGTTVRLTFFYQNRSGERVSKE
jgi:hypothetical protein